MVIKEDQLQCLTSFFDKKSTPLNKPSGSGVDAEPNYQLANELQRQVFRKFKRRKVYPSFRDNIWGADLADIQSLSKYNKGIKYLLSAIDIFIKYPWVFPLKDKKGFTIVNAFQKIISEGRKPNKIWADEGGELYNKPFKSILKINSFEMYFNMQ